MQIQSTYRSARISAFKCREVARVIQGLPVRDALDLLQVTPKKAARLILQTLKSAIANAQNNNNLASEVLSVCEASIGEGQTMKRFTPKARGSAGPIRKRMSHIKIVLTDRLNDLPPRLRSRAQALVARRARMNKTVQTTQPSASIAGMENIVS